MTKDNKNTGEARKDSRKELKEEGTRKLRKFAAKAKEKTEKELKDRKDQ